jgi:hypothetical protein
MDLYGDVVTDEMEQAHSKVVGLALSNLDERIAAQIAGLASCSQHGGEGGIRTLGTGVSPYNGLANRRIRPLCHLSGVRFLLA